MFRSRPVNHESGYEQDGSAPEIGLACGGVEDGYLAVVFTGRETFDAEVEGERHCAEPAGWIGRDGCWWRIENLVALLIQSDKGE